MIKEILHLDDELEARRILMRLGNGLPQVDAFIESWKEIKNSKPIIKAATTQKVSTTTSTEKETDIPVNAKVI